ncbi:MAG: VWA domain-containing protein [Bacteroidaceae bacterium]|nr:VWA domain-containing protein [Bacteroidaceae bacterium]
MSEVVKREPLRWGSDQPGHIVFLVDLSGSMVDKIDYVINALQKTCQSILTRCIGGGQVKNRVSVAIYGYNYHIVELLKCDAQGLARALKDAKRENRPLFDKNAEAKPEYQTCMKMGFEKAKQDVDQWIAGQKANGKTAIPAPIVINITDGQPYEGDDVPQDEVFRQTLQAARDLMNVMTMDGNVRIFNVHYDPETSDPTLRFPTSQPTLNENMAFLYQASSPMSDELVLSAQSYGFPEAVSGSRCMMSNEKDASKLASFIEWGSSK